MGRRGRREVRAQALAVELPPFGLPIARLVEDQTCRNAAKGDAQPASARSALICGGRGCSPSRTATEDGELGARRKQRQP